MVSAIEVVYALTDPTQAHLGSIPGRLLASSPHFPALLQRLVDTITRFLEKQLQESDTRRNLSDLSLTCLSRLVATQPRARWLLLAPGFDLRWSRLRNVYLWWSRLRNVNWRWSRVRNVWEEAKGDKTLRWMLEYIATSVRPSISQAARAEARTVCVLA
jgi:hypothetical protein